MTVWTLHCSRCGAPHTAGSTPQRCIRDDGDGACGGPLLVDYDLTAVAAATDPGVIASRAPTMWRYRELLPIERPSDIVSLGEGCTPLVPVPDPDGLGAVGALLIKDDGLNPTGTFKARGAACGISAAKALGVTDVALPTAGNAGGAWAAYGAAAGIRVHVALPADAPLINRLEPQAYGADVVEVDGLISDAGALIAEQIATHGWYDASTLHEPYRIEGKKTLGFEIAEQLARQDGVTAGWRLPDAIVYPAGGGVGLIGIWRAVQQLRELGWVVGDLPRMIVVQSSGCAPLVAAFETGSPDAPFWDGATTVAAGLRVPKALGDFLVLDAIRASGGTAIAIDDAEILAAIPRVAAATGVLCAPEGAAAVAAVSRLVARGDLGVTDRVVVINTGSGLKYPEALAAASGTAPSAILSPSDRGRSR